MNNKIEISAEIKAAVKQAMAAEKRRQLRLKLILIGAVAIFSPVIIYAASIAIPHRFSDGDTLSAAKLNENFDTLTTKVNSLDSKIGTYCGLTGSTYTGATVAGYTGAKAKCETACGNASAHMCTGHELSISRQLNIALPAVALWYSPGVFSYDGAVNGFECTGWSTASGGEVTNVWDGSRFSSGTCAGPRAIACCS